MGWHGAEGGAMEGAVDTTVALASGTAQASLNAQCMASLRELMQRQNISTEPSVLRHSLSDEELLRLGLLAAIALISPWKQEAGSSRLLLSDEGGLLRAYHPSSSESDIMLCVVCSLLAIIIMFHVTGAQQQYVQSPPSVEPPAPPPSKTS